MGMPHRVQLMHKGPDVDTLRRTKFLQPTRIPQIVLAKIVPYHFFHTVVIHPQSSILVPRKYYQIIDKANEQGAEN
jgi:hypothetical protein